MAYVGHSPVRDARDVPGVMRAIAHPSLFGRCALVAVAVAAAILALSDGFTPSAAPQTVTAAKADRIAAPRAASTVAGGFFHDPATRTTTVERGAVAPLGAQSPMLPGAK